MKRLVIWINVVLYLWTDIALAHAALEVYSARTWNLPVAGSRLVYAGLLGFAALYTAVGVFGLLRRSWWSRSMAFWWNLALAAIIGVLPALTAFWSARLERMDAMRSLRSPSVVMGLFAGCLFVALSLVLRTRALRDFFERPRGAQVSARARHS